MKQRNGRSNRMYIYGGWPVREALEGDRVLAVYLARGVTGDHINPIFSIAKEHDVPVKWVPKSELDSLVEGNHQGIVAETRGIRMANLNDIWNVALGEKSNGPRLLFLDGIQDPQNLGSILRSANFFGVPIVVVPNRRSAAIGPTVVRSSAGAALNLILVEVSNLAVAMDVARDKGLWIVGTDMNGDDSKVVDIPRPFALVMGSEGEGLHQLVRKKCDVVVSIKKFAKSGGIDSLNVGVACGILLHQFS